MNETNYVNEMHDNKKDLEDAKKSQHLEETLRMPKGVKKPMKKK